MTKFAQTLAQLRRRAGMTQEGLAEALDVSRQAVGKWEAGLAYPAAEKLPALADVLECSLDELLRGSVQDEGAMEPAADVPAPEEDQDAPALLLNEEDAPVDAHAPSLEEGAEETAPDDTAANNGAALSGQDALAAFTAYNAQQNRFSLEIAAGVALVLMGVAAQMFVSAWSGTLGIMALLTLISMAVMVFIAAGLSEAAFRNTYPVVENLYLPEELRRFRDVFAGGMAIGVGMIVLSPAAILLMELWPFGETWSIGAFMTILAGGVAAVVYLSLQYAKYHFKGRRPKGADRKAERKGKQTARWEEKVERQIGKAISNAQESAGGETHRSGRSWSSVILLGSLGLFFILGFLFHLWSVCWLVLPMGTILAGIAKAAPVGGARDHQP